MDDVKKKETEILDELKREVDDVEKDFETIRSDDVPETTRMKQQKVENILKEVHDQLDFLKDVVDTESN